MFSGLDGVGVSRPGYGGTISTANGTNCLSITPLTGNVFFRLRNP